jgi:hypothetical protein
VSIVHQIPIAAANGRIFEDAAAVGTTRRLAISKHARKKGCGGRRRIPFMHRPACPGRASPDQASALFQTTSVCPLVSNAAFRENPQLSPRPRQASTAAQAQIRQLALSPFLQDRRQEDVVESAAGREGSSMGGGIGLPA